MPGQTALISRLRRCTMSPDEPALDVLTRHRDRPRELTGRSVHARAFAVDGICAKDVLEISHGLTPSNRGGILLASYRCSQSTLSASRCPRAEHRRDRAISVVGHRAKSSAVTGPGGHDWHGRVKPVGASACRASRRPASTDGRVDRFATDGPNRRTCDVALGRSLRS